MVNQVIVLDSWPLGLITNPNLFPASQACAQWLQSHIAAETLTIIPEIADYEVRRELMRAINTKGIARLDSLCDRVFAD